MAFGALIIKANLGLTDEKLVEQIEENPYLKFFIGLEGFQYSAPFDPSIMIYFRKRLPVSVVNDCNERIVRHSLESNPSFWHGRSWSRRQPRRSSEPLQYRAEHHLKDDNRSPGLIAYRYNLHTRRYSLSHRSFIAQWSARSNWGSDRYEVQKCSRIIY